MRYFRAWPDSTRDTVDMEYPVFSETVCKVFFWAISQKICPKDTVFMNFFQMKCANLKFFHYICFR